MNELVVPPGLVQARHTPVFDYETLPEPLAKAHRTTVWATLHVQAGSVGYMDLEGDHRRDERVDAGAAW